MTDWVDVCSVDDINAKNILRFDYGENTYIICRGDNNKYYCTEGICSHQKAHLAEGSVDKFIIKCPVHAGSFDFRTGEAVSRPARKPLSTFITKVDNGRIFIKI